MLSKEILIQTYKKNYKPCFLLSWAKFLTYNELKITDNLEAYDAAYKGHYVKSHADWDKHVIPYTLENVKYALCIAMNIAANDMSHNNGELCQLYAADLQEWLNILEDKTIILTKNPSREQIIKFYNNISEKYKFDIKLT